MKTDSSSARPTLPRFGVLSGSLLALAAMGWLILIANLFGIAGTGGWIFPRVDDLAGLAASVLLFAVLAATPAALRALQGKTRKADP